MTTFTGAKGQLVQIALDPYTSDNLFLTRAYIGGVPANYVASTKAGSSITRPYPNPYHTNRTGTKSTYFIDDWYYRIHLIPNQLNIGNLVSSQSRDVLLWNAYLIPKTLESFTTSDMIGITVTPPDALDPTPALLPALGLFTYGVEVEVSGPPTINEQMSFEIDGITYVVPITGRRVVPFAFPPNWKSGVNETLEYKSTVIPNHDGSEQTASLRERPRRNYDYTALVERFDMQLFESLLFGWHSRLYAMPCWPEESKLLSAVAAGDTVLTFDTEHRSFVEGGLVAVYASPQEVEVREIYGIVGNSVTLTSPLEREHRAGTRIYPAFIAALNPSLSGTRHTDRLLEIPVRLECEPSVTPDVAEGAAGATYQTVELSRDRVNWGLAQNPEWASDRALLDTGTGKFALLTRSGFSQISKSHDWTLKNFAQVANFKGWLKRRGGRAVPVYLPSGVEDFTLAAPVLSSDTGIDCVANGYEGLVNAHPARRDIIVEFRDGTYLARRIQSAARTEEGLTRLVFTTTTGRNFNPADVKRISFLGMYRLGGDSITLSWLGKGLATASATMVNKRT
jgi:hypothetical protein